MSVTRFKRKGGALTASQNRLQPTGTQRTAVNPFIAQRSRQCSLNDQLTDEKEEEAQELHEQGLLDDTTFNTIHSLRQQIHASWNDRAQQTLLDQIEQLIENAQNSNRRVRRREEQAGEDERRVRPRTEEKEREEKEDQNGYGITIRQERKDKGKGLGQQFQRLVRRIAKNEEATLFVRDLALGLGEKAYKAAKSKQRESSQPNYRSSFPVKTFHSSYLPSSQSSIRSSQ
jgi:hypothetical protein